MLQEQQKQHMECKEQVNPLYLNEVNGEPNQIMTTYYFLKWCQLFFFIGLSNIQREPFVLHRKGKNAKPVLQS